MSTLDKKFRCDVCDICFDRKNKLDKHLNTDKHMRNIRTHEKHELMIEIDGFKKRCAQLEEKNRELEERLKDIEKQICKNACKTTNNYITNANTYSIGNTTIVVNVNPYGKENWDYLKDDILNIMKGVNSCIPEMVKSIHFNKEHPENHNIHLPNKKLSQIKTYNGHSWDTRNKKDAIETLITNLVDRLESEYGDEFRNNTTQFIQDLWEKKISPIAQEHAIDINLRKQVEFSILDGQAKLK